MRFGVQVRSWQCAGGVADPLGGSNAFQLTNSGEGVQSVSQTLNVPTGYIYSLSVYVQADAGYYCHSLLGSNSARRRPARTGAGSASPGAAIQRRHRFCLVLNCRPERSTYSGRRWKPKPLHRHTRRAQPAESMRTRDLATIHFRLPPPM
jgi:hypothetical protein